MVLCTVQIIVFKMHKNIKVINSVLYYKKSEYIHALNTCVKLAEPYNL